MFGLIVLVLLMFALGYANNLLGIFVFLLISFSVTSMYIANRNMQFTFIKDVKAEDMFAEQENKISVILNNVSDMPRYDFFLSYLDDPKENRTFVDEVSPLSDKMCEIPFSPLKRGYQTLPRLEVQSNYPFQMLTTWRYHKKQEEILVYPALKGAYEFPVSEKSSQSLGEQGLFRDHKTYSPGDPIRRINWLQSSKHQEILIKNYESNQDQSYEFFWEQTSRINNFEGRISQLALWIHTCELNGHQYALHIKNKSTDIGKGITHYRNCMKTLALLKEEEM